MLGKASSRKSTSTEHQLDMGLNFLSPCDIANETSP